jgi:predicted PurR-regulated permease PerM
MVAQAEDLDNQEAGKGQPTTSLALTYRRVFLAVGVLVLILITVLFLSYVIQIVLWVFAAILFAIFLSIPTDWISSKTPLPKPVTFFLSIFVILGLTALIGWLVFPEMLNQLSQIFSQLPDFISQMRANLQQYPWFQNMIDQTVNIQEVLPSVGSVGNILGRVSGVFSGALGAITNFLIFLVLGFYFAFEPKTYVGGLVRLFPSERRQLVEATLETVGVSLKWWLIGRLISMVILGALVGVGLFAIDLPVALGLAIITGVLSFIPVIGGLIAFIPSAIVALAQSPLTFLYVLLIYAAAQVVENYLLTPLVQRRTVFMAPALALTLQLLMGVLAGPLGVALAYPIAVVGQVLVKKLYLEKILGEQVEIVPEISAN